MTLVEGVEGKAWLERMGASDADRASRMGFVISDAMAAVVDHRKWSTGRGVRGESWTTGLRNC